MPTVQTNSELEIKLAERRAKREAKLNVKRLKRIDRVQWKLVSCFAHQKSLADGYDFAESMLKRENVPDWIINLALAGLMNGIASELKPDELEGGFKGKPDELS